jgi:TRAP-type mannitol/chloroaromatic compound transport system substrate-binding protein
MKRRNFLKSAGLGLAAGAATTSVAAPAIAQSQPEVRWRLASSFPKSLDTLFATGELVARRVEEATDGKFQIRPYAAGEIVPGLQVLDAVQNGTVQCGHSCGYYYVGKDPTFAFDTTLPFGPNARQHHAWMYHGGGIEALRAFYKDYNIVQFPAGQTGVQMGGWFRKEIKSVQDLAGLKMRIAGIAGEIMSRMGVVPQQIAGSDLYPALEKGTIDAAEWVGPYDDEKLGLNKVAKYYYYPGWWEGGPQVSLYVNLQEWEKLPKAYRSILESASAEATLWMQAKYDAENPKALKRLVGGGAQLRAFPRDVMEAAYKLAFEFYEATAKANPRFKAVYDSWKPFLDDEQLWFRVAEHTYDAMVMSASARRG